MRIFKIGQSGVLMSILQKPLEKSIKSIWQNKFRKAFDLMSFSLMGLPVFCVFFQETGIAAHTFSNNPKRQTKIASHEKSDSLLNGHNQQS